MTLGKLFVVPAMNIMGPVKDPRHEDLLDSWNRVDEHISKLFDPVYRHKFLDSRGNPLTFSWFFVNWSGFKTNPVHRDFGWFTIYDHYLSKFKNEMERYGDGMYWMYNHPAASGIGNEWGLDWFHNSNYFEILNRYVIERDYFPSVIQVVTEKNDASHWIDNWFPFDFSNRNSFKLDLNAAEEQGKTVGDVLDWKNAPSDWSEYRPSFEDYRLRGSMNRHIFRLLDIKTRIHQITEKEIEDAFIRCMNGKDTVIAAYEHDFREKADDIMDFFIKPITELAKKYPKVSWSYTNALNGAQNVCGFQNKQPPHFDVKMIHDEVRNIDAIRIRTSKTLFGPMPYVTSKDISINKFRYHPAYNIGQHVWQVDRETIPNECVLGIASSDIFGNVGLQKFRIKNDIINNI